MVDGYLIGFRAWRVGHRGPALRPLFVNATSAWEPGSAEPAECLVVSRSSQLVSAPKPWVHEVPHMECSCGLWALFSHDERGMDMVRAVPDEHHVVGAVLGWGRYVVHEGGFRSQFMRPVALSRPSTTASWHVGELCRRYAIPLVDGGVDLLRVAASRARGASAAEVMRAVRTRPPDDRYEFVGGPEDGKVVAIPPEQARRGQVLVPRMGGLEADTLGGLAVPTARPSCRVHVYERQGWMFVHQGEDR